MTNENPERRKNRLNKQQTRQNPRKQKKQQAGLYLSVVFASAMIRRVVSDRTKNDPALGDFKR
ncbi:MAG: hypothetical protein IKW76_14095, partial [Clostridia bacterium]|nr:hypothetical protein [Clostridia bacterium]